MLTPPNACLGLMPVSVALALQSNLKDWISKRSLKEPNEQPAAAKAK
jgi:hypothetical protein